MYTEILDIIEMETQEDIIQDEAMWLFGYGSLLFKPPLHHLDISKSFKKYDGYVNGYIRRFWQSSYDNRGTPEFKGRVVTIIPAHEVSSTESFHNSVKEHELNHFTEEEEINRILNNPFELHKELKLSGCVYYVPPKAAKEAREYLDFREKDGYVVEEIAFNVVGTENDPVLKNFPKNENGEPMVKCVVYVGSPTNESFVGPEDINDTAHIIHKAVGPSGPNIEYLLLLQKEDPKDSYLKQLKEKVEEYSF